MESWGKVLADSGGLKLWGNLQYLHLLSGIALSFGNRFNKSAAGFVLPASLQQLSFGYWLNQPILGGFWPTSALQQLSSGFSFNQPLAGVPPCGSCRSGSCLISALPEWFGRPLYGSDCHSAVILTRTWSESFGPLVCGSCRLDFRSIDPSAEACGRPLCSTCRSDGPSISPQPLLGRSLCASCRSGIRSINPSRGSRGLTPWSGCRSRIGLTSLSKMRFGRPLYESDRSGMDLGDCFSRPMLDGD